MTPESRYVLIDGHRLHQLILHPPEGVSEVGTAYFFHGQGDYVERYVDVLTPWLESGYRCIGTDLLGHGRSPGRRGHTGDMHLLDAVVDSYMENAPPNYAVIGHSMGGMLVLRHLILCGQGRYRAPERVWISSPLLRPSRGRPAWMLFLAQHLAGLWPRLTISTGIKPEMCRIKNDIQDAPVDPVKHLLWHRRISLGWASFLLDTDKLIEDSLARVPRSTRILITQGGDDPVCPPEFSQELFSRLQVTEKSYHLMPSMLHEPFAGEGSEQLEEYVRVWLQPGK